MVVPCCPQWSRLAASRGGARRRRRQERASVSEAWFAAVDDCIDGRKATRLLAGLPWSSVRWLSPGYGAG